jgi:hypothetical protein
LFQKHGESNNLIRKNTASFNPIQSEKKRVKTLFQFPVAVCDDLEDSEEESDLELEIGCRIHDAYYLSLRDETNTAKAFLSKIYKRSLLNTDDLDLIKQDYKNLQNMLEDGSSFAHTKVYSGNLILDHNYDSFGNERDEDELNELEAINQINQMKEINQHFTKTRLASVNFHSLAQNDEDNPLQGSLSFERNYLQQQENTLSLVLPSNSLFIIHFRRSLFLNP